MNDQTPLRVEALFVTPFEVARSHEYDVIIVGGGGTSATLLERVLQSRPSAKVLVLEQGPYLLPDHAQNLGRGFQPLMMTASATPWRSDGDLDVVAQVPYLGGRTLVWSGSTPQPSRDQLSRWPSRLIDELELYWPRAAAALGVHTAPQLGREYGHLHRSLREIVFAATRSDAGLIEPETHIRLDAPLAHGPSRGGAVTKYSAVRPLIEHAADHPDTVHIVTGCHVDGLEYDGDRVVTIATALGSIQSGGADVVLAMGTVEATTVLLKSPPPGDSSLIGQNFAANTASFLTCRIPRARFDGLGREHAELSALYVDGATAEREFHLHVTACATSDPDRDIDRIYRLLPDMFGDGTPRRVSDADHVVLLVHGLAELSASGRGDSGNSVRIGADGIAVGTLRLGEADEAVWAAMDAAIDRVVQNIAAGHPIEYWSHEDGEWSVNPPRRRMPFAFHETGTLWMGTSAASSVTDLHGRLHGTANLFVLGGATFPTRGSWNPFLTMSALALRLADHLASR